MGMSIDEAIPILHDMYNYYNDADIDAFVGFDEDDNNAIKIALDTMRKYQLMQADYEARLKADLVAMLEDLKQDFIAEAYGIEMDCTDYVVNVADIDKVIQQKINALKENNHDD